MREALKKIKDAGVMFYVQDIMGGCRDLDIDDLVTYIENKDNFFADLYDVNVEKIRQYKEFSLNPQCTTTIAKNERCPNRAGWNGVNLSEFEYGESTLCKNHQKDFLSRKYEPRK